MSAKTKIILDTDIGSDIDDALCLAYLLAQPACDLLGITTVSGNSLERAKLASVLCYHAGRQDIPIYPGIESPLKGEQKQLTVPQSVICSQWDHQRLFSPNEVIPWMREAILSHPQEVVLLGIGPLTNIATLFSRYPETVSAVKGVMLMGGSFPAEDAAAYDWYPIEWNMLLDPEAAALVLTQPVPWVRMVSIDITMRVRIPSDQVAAVITSPLLAPVGDIAHIWAHQSKFAVFHDPLAGACLFRDDLCRFSAGTIAVELSDQEKRGMTTWQEGGISPRHYRATTVDSEMFIDHFSRMVSGPAK